MASLAGCGGEETATAQAGEGETAPLSAVPVTVGSVQTITIPQTVEVVGTLQADTRTTIAAEVGGRVVEATADLGDRLPGNAVLARVDPQGYQLVVEQRQAALGEALASLGLSDVPSDDFDVTQVSTVQRTRLQADNAQSRLDRAARLYEQTPPLISEQEYADIRTTAEVAQQDYDVALLQARSALAAARTRAREVDLSLRDLEKATLRTPMAADGVEFAVARRYVEVGQLISNGDAAYELVVDHPLRFRGAVPERYVQQIQLGQEVVLALAGVNEPVEGVISRIDPTIDNNSRTFLIEARVENEDRQLRPGGFARAAVHVGVLPAVRLPAAAMVSFAGTHKVFTVEEGQAREYPVVVISRNEATVTLEPTLPAEQPVVISGASRLAHGMAVTVEDVPASVMTTPR